MDKQYYSEPFSLRNIQIDDTFWKNEMELVRTQVIPYQWNALNDNIPGASPSFCMRNFKVAARMNEEKAAKGSSYVPPKYEYRGFEALPEDPANPDPDKFYGFVFQDTDFSKWIEAVGYSLTQHPDAELEATADAAIDIVCKAQQDDGYLDTYYIINGRDMQFTNLRDHHELYCFGHLVEGAVAYYEATGKDKLLNAARRFADYIADNFGYEDGKSKGYPGHEIAEMALIRLYEATNDPKYYELSKFFIEARGTRPYYFDTENHPEVNTKSNDERYQYQQAHRPVKLQDEAVGHSVRAVYLYSGMADLARISEDEEMYAACLRLWDSITGKKMYITGGIGATHLGESFSYNYDLPNDTAYAETCASIGMAFFARRMLEMDPNSKYADVMEREVYNGILSGMALDGKSFFYVNPLEVNPIACHKDERKYHVKPIRQKWFGCACCPPNLARFLSSISSYAYTENQDTLFMHLYVGGKLTKATPDGDVTLNVSSSLPWEGNVSINVKAHNKKFTLAIRIPGWCNGKYTLTGYNGELTYRDGYIYLTKDWAEDETINIEFPMEVKFIKSNQQVRENIGKVAVTRGPVVYCMEEADNGNNLHLCKIDVTGTPITETTSIEDVTSVKIKVPGVRVSAESNDSLYSEYTNENVNPTTLEFIPYYMWANRGENEMQVYVSVK